MDWTLEQSPLKLVFAWRSFSKDGVSQWIPLLKEAHNGLTGGAQIGQPVTSTDTIKDYQAGPETGNLEVTINYDPAIMMFMGS